MNLLSGTPKLPASKKVKLPIVGIHGNHDYPMKTNLKNSAYDMLSITKCVTYIGRVHELSDPVFKPTIFLREKIALIIYGIGHIKDTTLISILEQKKYTIEEVPSEITSKYKCVKILLFHQNRYKVISIYQGDGKGPSSAIKFNLLPPGFDLVIWGHEHDCFTSLIAVVDPETRIYQPGSSIATSFTEGEALPKHIGLLEILGDGSFRLEYIRLQTVREMLVEDRDFIYFQEEDLRENPRTENEIKKAIRDYVIQMIKTANESKS